MTDPAISDNTATTRPAPTFLVGVTSAGTLIVWYDFFLYGVLAAFFSRHFFSPSMDQRVAFIAGLAVFWTGFLVRPIGALVFGHLADRLGRRRAIQQTLLLMGVTTFIVGLLPGYDTIGHLAPILLVAMRVLQGFALGGEYTAVATYVSELAPEGKSGLYTGWVQTTGTMGLVLAFLVVLLCRLGFGDAAFGDWAWRVPFLISAVLVWQAAWLRTRLPETPTFAAAARDGDLSSSPALETLGSGANWKALLLSLFGATAPEGVVWYTGQIYAVFYMTEVMKLSWVTAYLLMIVTLTLASPMFILFGALSDRVRRTDIMTLGLAIAVISFWPVYNWMDDFRDSPLMLGVLVFYLMIPVTMVYGPIAAWLAELFPTRIRCTSVSLTYHVGNGVFGGLVPTVGVSLAAANGVTLSAVLYPMVVATVGVLVNLIAYNEPARRVPGNTTPSAEPARANLPG